MSVDFTIDGFGGWVDWGLGGSERGSGNLKHYY